MACKAHLFVWCWEVLPASHCACHQWPHWLQIYKIDLTKDLCGDFNRIWCLYQISFLKTNLASPLRLKINRIALFWTFSSCLMSLAKQGSHTGHPYSSMGLTIMFFYCCLVLESALFNNLCRPFVLATKLSICLLHLKL